MAIPLLGGIDVANKRLEDRTAVALGNQGAHAGQSSMEAIQAAKSVGAFSGKPLRRNLINQLNHWGFHKWLGLTDSADLSPRRATWCRPHTSRAIRCSARTTITVAPQI